jgi:hypothetical protein
MLHVLAAFSITYKQRTREEDRHTDTHTHRRNRQTQTHTKKTHRHRHRHKETHTETHTDTHTAREGPQHPCPSSAPPTSQALLPAAHPPHGRASRRCHRCLLPPAPRLLLLRACVALKVAAQTRAPISAQALALEPWHVGKKRSQNKRKKKETRNKEKEKEKRKIQHRLRAPISALERLLQHLGRVRKKKKKREKRNTLARRASPSAARSL